MTEKKLKVDQQAVNPETSLKIFLKFCSGSSKLGVLPGHIWKAVTEEQWSGTEENMGWMTVEQAQEQFGKENVVKTGSSTICDSCAKAIFSE